jgi:DNA-binding response OmpR family regulator
MSTAELPRVILVVDDDPATRQVVRTVLEADEYQVVEAADGHAALMLLDAIAGGKGPDLVLLDIMMPGIDGIDVCRRIDHERIKVVMLTARDDAETRTAAEDAGADAYITKPFEATDLLAEIERNLS